MNIDAEWKKMQAHIATQKADMQKGTADMNALQTKYDKHLREASKKGSSADVAKVHADFAEQVKQMKTKLGTYEARQKADTAQLAKFRATQAKLKPFMTQRGAERAADRALLQKQALGLQQQEKEKETYATNYL